MFLWCLSLSLLFLLLPLLLQTNNNNCISFSCCLSCFFSNTLDKSIFTPSFAIHVYQVIYHYSCIWLNNQWMFLCLRHPFVSWDFSSLEMNEETTKNLKNSLMYSLNTLLSYFVSFFVFLVMINNDKKYSPTLEEGLASESVSSFFRYQLFLPSNSFFDWRSIYTWQCHAHQ